MEKDQKRRRKNQNLDDSREYDFEGFDEDDLMCFDEKWHKLTRSDKFLWYRQYNLINSYCS